MKSSREMSLRILSCMTLFYFLLSPSGMRAAESSSSSEEKTEEDSSKENEENSFSDSLKTAAAVSSVAGGAAAMTGIAISANSARKTAKYRKEKAEKKEAYRAARLKLLREQNSIMRSGVATKRSHSEENKENRKPLPSSLKRPASVSENVPTPKKFRLDEPVPGTPPLKPPRTPQASVSTASRPGLVGQSFYYPQHPK